MVIIILVAPPEILEYCPVSELLEREDYYFKLFKPEYNILKKAEAQAPCLGSKRCEETRAKMAA
jgi:hypothetical protein